MLPPQCYQPTGLVYEGLDIVIDKDKVALVLELNARPGVNIQIANRAGLLPRLDLIEQNHTALHTIDECVHFAQRSFGALS